MWNGKWTLIILSNGGIIQLEIIIACGLFNLIVRKKTNTNETARKIWIETWQPAASNDDIYFSAVLVSWVCVCVYVIHCGGGTQWCSVAVTSVYDMVSYGASTTFSMEHTHIQSPIRNQKPKQWTYEVIRTQPISSVNLSLQSSSWKWVNVWRLCVCVCVFAALRSLETDKMQIKIESKRKEKYFMSHRMVPFTILLGWWNWNYLAFSKYANCHCRHGTHGSHAIRVCVIKQTDQTTNTYSHSHRIDYIWWSMIKTFHEMFITHAK